MSCLEVIEMNSRLETKARTSTAIDEAKRIHFETRQWSECVFQGVVCNLKRHTSKDKITSIQMMCGIFRY